MTKRKDKKAPVKISATEKVASAKDEALTEEVQNNAEQVKDEVVIEQAQVEEKADEIVIEEAEQEVKAEETSKTEKPQKQAKTEKGKDKNDKNKPKKEKKERKGLKRRTKETMSELKKVIWPKFPEVVKKTGVVITVVVIFAIVLLGLDLLLGYISSVLMRTPFTPFS